MAKQHIKRVIERYVGGDGLFELEKAEVCWRVMRYLVRKFRESGPW